MLESFLWGLLSAGSLLVGTILAIKTKFSPKMLGAVMAFGVGALICSTSFELVGAAFSYINELHVVLGGVVSGALVYLLCDYMVDRRGGKHRKSSMGDDNGSGMAILIGTILDGIPESLVIGLSLAQGGIVSATMIVAVFISNLPEGLSSSVGLLKSGWKKSTLLGFWSLIVVISALASLAGFAFFKGSPPRLQSFILAFAGGAILTMLSDSMMPEAYRNSGKLTGLITTLGFSVAFAVSAFE